jgi:hypothetical protein
MVFILFFQKYFPTLASTMMPVTRQYERSQQTGASPSVVTICRNRDNGNGNIHVVQSPLMIWTKQVLLIRGLQKK